MNVLQTYEGLPANNWHYLALGICGLQLMIFLTLVWKRNSGDKVRKLFAIALGGFSAVGALILLGRAFFASSPIREHFRFSWFEISGLGGAPPLSFTGGVILDEISILMAFLVLFIAFLVQLFSWIYMKGDPRIHQYYAYLGLFCFSMLGIVFSDNLLFLFIFWELVGFCSWLLIGFWHHRESPGKASMKAFLLNRIGDIGFFIGLALLFVRFHSLDIPYLQQAVMKLTPEDQPWLIATGLCFIGGAVGKSAQFPLQVWLPDAMEGPTPVSSLIHAATMVAAGVYVLVRCFFLLAIPVQQVLIVIGLITMLVGAISATKQWDIKQVLAYSTISQLGYMILAVGLGVPQVAFFHLLTHAFFKCGLFLNAGTIIHCQHELQHRLETENVSSHFDVQDMRLMGGMRKSLKKTFVLFLVFAAGLAGLPLTAGFLSKEMILHSAFVNASGPGIGGYFVFGFGVLGTFLTATYVTRMGLLVFGGQSRLGAFLGGVSGEKLTFPKERALLFIPMSLLAVFCLWIGFSPASPFSAKLILPGLKGSMAHHHVPGDWLVPFLSLIAITIGALLSAIRYYSPSEKFLLKDTWFDRFIRQHFFLDMFYAWIANKVFGAIVFLFRMINSWLNIAVNLSGRFFAKDNNRSVSGFISWSDNHILDRFVNGFAGGIYRAGKWVTKTQSGKIQLYLIGTVVGMLSLIAYLIYLYLKSS